MRTIISTSEVVGTIAGAKGGLEVCATGEAAFDEAASLLVMKLQSFLRGTGRGAGEEPVRRAWLPPDETVRENLEFEEALPAAREIFQSWAAKVRRCIPNTELQPV